MQLAELGGGPFKTRPGLAIVAWRQKETAWQVAGGLQSEADRRWTVRRIGRRAQTYARRAGAENALDAYFAEGADSAHQRLALQRLPTEKTIDRHEMLREHPPAPVRPAILATNGRMTLARGDGALTGIVIALEQGGWHAEWPGSHGSVFKTHDDALAACRPDPALLPDLRAQGAIQTPSA